jgi:hypothetical protein
MFGYKVYTARVANQNNAIGELLGEQMKVKHRPVGVDDQF